MIDVLDEAKIAPIQSNENFSPGAYAKKFSHLQVHFLAMQPTEYAQ